LLLTDDQDSDNPRDFEIWDYKGTNRVFLTARDLQTYEFQMRVYARLYEIKHGVRPQRIVLYFINELDGPTCPDTRPVNALLSVSLDPADIDTAMQEFVNTVADIENARQNATWSPAQPGQISAQDCTICDLRWNCPTPNNGQGVQLRYP
jgi:putative RecB family exonuclease